MDKYNRTRSATYLKKKTAGNSFGGNQTNRKEDALLSICRDAQTDG